MREFPEYFQPEKTKTCDSIRATMKLLCHYLLWHIFYRMLRINIGKRIANNNANTE